MTRLLAALAAAAVLAAGCSPKAVEITPEMRQAQFAWDLGPDSIDVFRYPEDRKAQYSLFKNRCSSCHTLARPINAPYTSPQEWTDYVERMNKRAGGVLLDPGMAQHVVAFLVYDAQQRKSAPAFGQRTKELEALFKRVKEEKP